MNFKFNDPRTNWKYVAIVVVLGLVVGGLVIWYGKSIPEAPASEVSFTKPPPQEGSEEVIGTAKSY